MMKRLIFFSKKMRNEKKKSYAVFSVIWFCIYKKMRHNNNKEG